MKKWILKFAAVLLLSGSFAFGQTGGGGTGTGGGGVRVTGTPAANDCAKFVNSNTITTAGAACGTGAGGVTSVGLTVNSTSPSGIFTVTGSPVTTSGSLNFNLAGTSGGIPYFSSSTVISTSGALTANLPVIGGGAGVAPSVGTVTGNTTQFPTWTGATTTSRCVDTDASGNLKISAADCGAGTVTSIATTAPIGGGTITTTGTITCTTCVVASSPGVGLAHFAGSTQTVTSSAVTAADATGNTSGSGNFCLTTSCSMVTPALGTPASGVLTNATGYPWSSLAAGSGNLSIATGGTSIFNTTTALSQFFAFKNTTAAVVGTSQGSPILSACGTAFHGSASVEDCMTFSELPGNGNDAAIVQTIGHTGTSTGTITTAFPGIVTAGDGLSGAVGYGFSAAAGWGMYRSSTNGLLFQVSSADDLQIRGSQNGVNIGSPGTYGIVSTGNFGTATLDTGFSRCAAGIACFGNGTAGDTTARVKASAYMSVGTKFTTNAGCGESAGTTTGGATAGKFTTAGSTSCTTIITMGNAATAPTGWSCNVKDLTTVGDITNPKATSSTATTVTITSGTIVAADVIEFGCIGY